MRIWRILLCAIALTLPACAIFAQGTLTDPYAILERNFEASGGLDRLKAEKRSYFEGEISLASLTGTIEAWSAQPDLKRSNVKLGPISITQGNNGKFQWVIDTNGKLQKTTKEDEASLKRKEVSHRLDDYEYADPKSDIFKVTFQGTEAVEDVECYVLILTNSINDDTRTFYFRTDNFLLAKTVAIEGDGSYDAYFDDYRDVDGMKVAYRTRTVPHVTKQPQVITINTYVSNLDIDPALFEPPGEGVRDFVFAKGASSENIPFRFVAGHVYIPVVLAGKERYWILDTGAGKSCIDKTFAEELGLVLEGGIKGGGAGGTVDIYFTTIPEFSLQGIEFASQQVASFDMTTLRRAVGPDAVGILGFDFLSRFVTRIDFANESISFYDPETFEYHGHGSSVDLHLDGNVFTTKAVLDGTHDGIWLFDVGASSVSLNTAYARINGYAERKGVIGIGRGAGAEFQIKSIKADSMRIGGFTVHRPPVHFSYGVPDSAYTSDQLGGLGNTLFRNFVMYLDYAKERVILEKGDKFDQPWPEDHSGLGLMRTEDFRNIQVDLVSPGTPAEKAGLQKGDILKAVNAIPVKQLGGLIAVRELLMAAPGTPYAISVDRGGVEKTFKLKLAELY